MFNVLATFKNESDRPVTYFVEGFPSIEEAIELRDRFERYQLDKNPGEFLYVMIELPQ